MMDVGRLIDFYSFFQWNCDQKSKKRVRLLFYFIFYFRIFLFFSARNYFRPQAVPNLCHKSGFGASYRFHIQPSRSHMSVWTWGRNCCISRGCKIGSESFFLGNFFHILLFIWFIFRVVFTKIKLSLIWKTELDKAELDKAELDKAEVDFVL